MNEEIRDDSREIQMVLALDDMAARYGLLPSEVIGRASTFDLAILDMARTYRLHLQKRAQAHAQGLPMPAPDLSEDELLKIMESTRNAN